ncbi:MAG: NADH-quinone oxidoreductase subunit C [Candidatus Hodarchaeales archaeon]
MSDNIPQSLIEVANSLNLPIREPREDPLSCYVTVNAENLVELVKKLKSDYGVYFVSGVIAYEAGDKYHLHYPFSILLPETKWGKLIFDVAIDKNNPVVDSITSEIPGIIIAEREAYDMLGIKFRNHPDHRRILTADIMPDDLFPLRKEHTFQEIRERLAEEAQKRSGELT